MNGTLLGLHSVTMPRALATFVRARTFPGLSGALLLAACGGSCPQAADASSEGAQGAQGAQGATEAASDSSSEPAEKSEDQESAREKTGEGDTTDAPSSDAKASDGAAGPNPSFPENASVAQAVAAVPKGTQRANIEPDVLGEPLQNAALYEPCKVGAQHFKLKVAVWGGKAVGVDVTTSSKNLGECIAKQVRTIQWRDTVRSLNTVEYSM